MKNITKAIESIDKKIDKLELEREILNTQLGKHLEQVRNILTNPKYVYKSQAWEINKVNDIMQGIYNDIDDIDTRVQMLVFAKIAIDVSDTDIEL